MADIARLVEVIEPEVQAMGFELVRVKIYKGGEIGSISGDYDEPTLQIMAERPETGQLVLEDCAALSHRISDRIDALEEAGEVLIEEAYRLEVSSPGIDRPLTRLRDFVQWTGHEAKVSLTAPVDGNRKAVQGDLVGVEGEIIVLADRKSGEVRFPFSDIQGAKLVLTDRLIAASKPIDATGADEEDIVAGAEGSEEQED